MASQIIKFGTLDMTEAVEQMTETNDNRVNIQNIVNRHGGLVTDTVVLDGRIIRMTGQLNATDATTLRDTLDQYETLLGTTRQKLYTLFDDRYFNAYKSRFNYKYVTGSALKVAEFELEFLADDPFEYKDPAPSPTVSVLTAADTAVGGGQYKKNFIINNVGNAYSFITATVTANQGVALGHATIRNLTLSKEFNYVDTVSIGANVVVNSGNFTIQNSITGNRLSKFTGAFIYLNPGNNTIEIQGEPATYSIAYDERYY